ncbi:hypothetical protein ACJX0J_019010, partial [Zea mays]
ITQGKVQESTKFIRQENSVGTKEQSLGREYEAMTEKGRELFRQYGPRDKNEE